MLADLLVRINWNDIFCPDLKLGYNVCYIVAGVAIEDGKVLMMQEAKASCRGRWYLPAGRMEKDESIVVSKLCVFLSSIIRLSIAVALSRRPGGGSEGGAGGDGAPV